ncbi:MAG TPA: hypothetical protein VGL86_06600 [Polyangia bacterium]
MKLGFGALSVMLMIGCGGQASSGDLTADQDLSDAKEDSARKQSHPEFYKCATDDDCVAIDQAGCCPNGFLVAVNKKEVKAYDTKYACTNPPQFCPLFVVDDKRVAQCDFSHHQCQMIDPTDIRCGGFIDPSLQHSCPAGFSCQFNTVPDVPGTCVAAQQ